MPVRLTWNEAPGEGVPGFAKFLLFSPLLDFPRASRDKHSFCFFGAWQGKGTFMCVISFLLSEQAD